MSRSQPQPVTPHLETRGGHTWLTYPQLAVSGGPLPDSGMQPSDTSSRASGPGPGLSDAGTALGVVVFKDNGFASDRHRWLRRAGDFISENAGVRVDRLVVPLQVHSRDVCRIDSAAPRACDMVREEEMVCDGLVTVSSNLMVGVTVADCVPLLAFSRQWHVAGAAHCGWRGIAGGIVGEFVAAIRQSVGDSGDMGTVKFLVGPSIGPCCYEVKEDLLSQFEDRERRDHVRHAGGRLYFDLRRTVTARLTRLGVQTGQIYVDNTCTSCQQSLLSSYRARGRDCGRMLAYAMLTR